MCKYYFNKKVRLSNTISFKTVFNNHCKINTREIIILGHVNLLNYPRLGLSISRKYIKYAHDRNLIKRLIRETFRILQYQLISMDFVVIIKKKILFLSNRRIIDMLNDLWSHYYR